MQAADDAQHSAATNAPVGAASGNRERCQIAVQLSQATTASAHVRQHRKRHQLRHQLARFQRALSDQPPCNDFDDMGGRGEMRKAPIELHDLRRRIYVKAKAE